jgi:hypothetical protein
LSSILINTYEKLAVNYHFCNDNEFYTDEIFCVTGFLVLFLYDKQKYINRFCCEQLSPNTKITLLFDNPNESPDNNQDVVYTFLNISCTHNISNLNDYYKTLKFLSLIITNQINHHIQDNNTLHLDAIYEKFMVNCKLNLLISEQKT